MEQYRNYRRKKIIPLTQTRERKLNAEMKRLRQQIARSSNEIYQITLKRKAEAKEKELLNELKKLMGGVDPTTRMLKECKERQTNKLSYKEI